MGTSEGRITEIVSGINKRVSFRIDSSPEVIPDPGEYLLANDPDDSDSVLPVPLFRVGTSSQATLQSTSEIPSGWGPGSTLNLRGPLGTGFQIPTDTRHLALAALGGSFARLLPLVNPALENGADIALFITAAQLSASPFKFAPLPAAIETHPLSALPESLKWADTLALDVPLDVLPTVRQILALDPHEIPPCLAQALIITPMPCGAIAECGVCAVPAPKRFKLACKDGPVFDLKRLRW